MLLLNAFLGRRIITSRIITNVNDIIKNDANIFNIYPNNISSNCSLAIFVLTLYDKHKSRYKKDIYVPFRLSSQVSLQYLRLPERVVASSATLKSRNLVGKCIPRPCCPHPACCSVQGSGAVTPSPPQKGFLVLIVISGCDNGVCRDVTFLPG